MRSSVSLFALSAPLLASAALLFSRAASANDILVFQFAHVLEQLETQFYTQAIQKYKVEDFIAAGYSSAEVAVEQLQSIVADETAHTSTLESAIKSFGVEPISNCVFNFDSALTDVATTMTVARVVELVGVGAYLGAAGLLDDPRFLTSAASILTIESRHSTILNALNGGVAIPQAFDIPLAPNQVLAIAGGFITGCDLGVAANKPLTITNTGAVAPGTKLTFQSDAIASWDPNCPLFCNMIVGGAVDSITLPIDQCIVPDGIVGPVALIITSDPQPLLASQITDQNQKTTVAGPAIAFIDFGVPEQTLAQLILTPGSPLTKDLNGAAPVVPPTTTSTISNEEASSVVSEAGGAAAATDASAYTTSTDANAYQTSATTSAVDASETQVDEGSIVPLMPSSASVESAPFDANSVSLPTTTSVDSAGLPIATPDAAGAGAASSDLIIPLMPQASAPAAAGQVNIASPVVALGFDA